MRVIAGQCRGMKLTAPPGITTRPTSDRVKEALFSIVASLRPFTGTRILDICAGTGSLGIEALSRGALSCTFIEHERTLKAVLEKNLTRTHLDEKSETLMMDAIKALHVLKSHGRVYDLVFFDPPYNSGLYASIPEVLCSGEIMAAGSILVVECSARNALPTRYGSLVRFDRRVYGDTALELFTREDV